MQENLPTLISCKPLKPLFTKLQKIHITSENFSIGRGLQNSEVIPFLSISRNHCLFIKDNDNWKLEDFSTFGIKVNNDTIGKGKMKQLVHGDIIELEPSGEFVYKFHHEPYEVFESPKKRIKLEKDVSNDIINDVKTKFEESQSFELMHIEGRIQNAKQMQMNSLLLKDQLQLNMNKKILELENDFAAQIENLKGERNEVERQKAILLEERDIHLAAVKQEMEGKITELMEQIQQQNETESELLKENSLLKEKLLKEREEFLAELSRENSSKQDMLKNLESKIREQEDVRLKQKQELEELQQKVEDLKKAKENELKELDEQKKLQLEQEKAEIQRKAEHSLEAMRKQVSERETELAALAAERIQQQAEQSTKVITSLQEQLEEARGKLKSVETEKNALLESRTDKTGEGTSREVTTTELGELMDSELQCSICAEWLVSATTLNCSHTFCKYCITMWKKKKKECPICRSPITTECKSLVLDSLIETMVQNSSEDVKLKRQEMLKNREELETELARQLSVGTSRGSDSFDDTYYSSSENSEYSEERSPEEEYDYYYDDYFPFDEYTDSGPDYDSSEPGDYDASATSAVSGNVPANLSNTESGPQSGSAVGRRRIAGIPGSYYGGYGRCFRCGNRGHWAPGCPLR